MKIILYINRPLFTWFVSLFKYFIELFHRISICKLQYYLIFIIGLHQRGHQFIGLVFALQLGMGLFALRLFQIYPTLLLRLLKCHLSVYNISERSNQSSFTRQKIVCILIFMCLKEVSCFFTICTSLTFILYQMKCRKYAIPKHFVIITCVSFISRK